jgi:hypothetical protein
VMLLYISAIFPGTSLYFIISIHIPALLLCYSTMGWVLYAITFMYIELLLYVMTYIYIYIYIYYIYIYIYITIIVQKYSTMGVVLYVMLARCILTSRGILLY